MLSHSAIPNPPDLLLDALYETVSDPRRWSAAWQRAIEFLGPTNGIATFRRSSGELAYVFATAGAHPDIIEKCISTQFGPWDRACLDNPGTLLALDDRDLAFKCAVPVAGGTYLLGFGPFAHDGSVSPRARLLAILPHLARSIRASHSFSKERALRTAIYSRLPYATFIVDGDGVVISCNDRAESILTRGRYLAVKEGVLQFRDPVASGAFRSFIELDAQIVPRSEVFVAHSQDRAGIALCRMVPVAMPFTLLNSQGQAQLHVVIITERDWPNEQVALSAESALRAMFGLTRAEGRVAIAAVFNPSVKQISSAIGIGRESVRWHLKNIYLKTRTTCLADLVSLVATGPLL